MPRSSILKAVRTMYYPNKAIAPPTGNFLLDLFPTNAVFVGGFRRYRAGFTGNCVTVVDVASGVPGATQGIGLGGDDKIDSTALLAFALANGGNAYIEAVTNQVLGGTATWAAGSTRPQIVSSNTLITNSAGDVAADFNNNSMYTVAPVGPVSTSGGITFFAALEYNASIGPLDTAVRVDATSNIAVRGIGNTNYEVNGADFGTALDVAGPGTNVPNVFYLSVRNAVDARSAVRDSVGVVASTTSTATSFTTLNEMDNLVSTRFWNDLGYGWALYSQSQTNQEMDDMSAFLL